MVINAELTGNGNYLTAVEGNGSTNCISAISSTKYFYNISNKLLERDNKCGTCFRRACNTAGVESGQWCF